MFLYSNFLEDMKISVFRIHFKADIVLLIFARIFWTSWPKMGVLGGKEGRVV